MARPITQIQQQMLDNIAADTVLSLLLTSESKRAIYRLFCYIVAVAINVMEQLMDVFSAAVETTVAHAAPASAPWIQDQVFKFQYSADVPQIVQLINFAPAYPTVNPLYQIITRASVTTDISNQVVVKVAKGDTPTALSVNELAALQSYVNIIGGAGITYNVVSIDADRLFIGAQVFYNGQYSDVISANTIQAINVYLSTLPFNGQVRVSDLEATIRGVAGVTDVILQNVYARANTVLPADATYLVLNNQVIGRLWPTVAGYIIGEDTSGSTFADTLTFIPE